MYFKNVINQVFRRKISSISKKIEIDSVLYENPNLKPKKHPGIIKAPLSPIPKDIQASISYILKDAPVNSLYKEGQSLKLHLKSRHRPIEPEQLSEKEIIAQNYIFQKNKINIDELSQDEKLSLINFYKKEIKKYTNAITYNWQPIKYDKNNCLRYLLGCAASNYAVLQQIFYEIKKREPDFKPASLFDFGSGVGTVSWSAINFWKPFLKEYFNVDSSKEMNDLSNSILNHGKKGEFNKGIFYRQFLPASNLIKYDLVVSAYSLSELPSEKSKLETILNLWNKTQQFLVIVEEGTKEGFKIVNDARDMILSFNKNNKKDNTKSYVFSPCPHNNICPKTLSNPNNALCNFQVKYSNTLIEKSTILNNTYSYIVLRRGINSENIIWPRLISQPLPRTRHVICRACTQKGNLEEYIFTKSKHSKLLYQCAKRSSWGDFLPVSEIDLIEDNKSKIKDN